MRRKSPRMRIKLIGLIPFILMLMCCEDRHSLEIEIIKPVDGANLRRDVTIEVDVQNNDDVSAVDIYIDDELFRELTQPPWKTTWNTRDTENGSHTIKCKGRDVSDNEKVSPSIEVIVENTLISAIFTNDWICTNCDRGVLFVSAPDGTLLGEASWTGNDTVRIFPTHTTRPDTGRINVTTIRHDGLGNILVTTYMEVPGGERIKYKGLPRAYLNDFEYMVFQLSNIPTHNGWSISNGFADAWAYPSVMGASVNTRNYMDEVSVYLQLSNTSVGTQYLWLPNQVSGTVSLDLSSMSQASSQVIQFPPGGNQARSILTGYRNAESYYEAAYLLDRQRLFDSSNNTMTVHPPPGLMADYKTYMYFFEAGGWVYNTVFGEIPESFNKIQADLDFVSTSREAFEITTSGEFDQIKSLWRHNISGGTVDWNIYGPPDLTAYQLPILPSVAQEIFPQVQREQIVLLLADLIDYTELNSYDEVLETRFQTDGYFNEYVRESRTRSKSVSAGN